MLTVHRMVIVLSTLSISFGGKIDIIVIGVATKNRNNINYDQVIKNYDYQIDNKKK